MKKTGTKLLSLALFVGLASSPALAQTGGGGGQGGQGDGGLPGGTYDGPGDVVPPGGGTGGNGGGNPGGPPKPPPGVNGPGAGYAPGANPLAPPPFLPGGPGDPSGTGANSGPRSPGSRPRTDSPTSWQLWWHYNRWDHLHTSKQTAYATTGSGGFFLGRGQSPQMSPTRRAGSTELRDLVQPALIDIVSDATNIDLASRALLAYGKLRDIPAENEEETFFKVVLPRLRDGSQAISERAILALGVRGEDESFAHLASIALDEDAGRELLARQRITLRQRFFAIAGLGLLGERTKDDAVRVRTDAVLKRLMWDERDLRPELRAVALLAMGHVALPTDDQIAAAEGLPDRARTRVDQVLSVLAVFEHEDSDILAKSQAPRAAARLVRDAPESLRLRVMRSFLNAIGPHSKERREVLGATIQALGLIATSGSDPVDTDVRRELERMAYGSGVDRLVRSFAIVSLARASARPGPGEEPMAGYEPTKRLFQKRLLRSRGQTLAWTALALGLIEEDAASRGGAPDADVTYELRKVLENNRNEEVAGAAAVALGLVRDIEAEELLFAKLNDSSNERVRAYAALALGMIGEPSAVQELRAHVQRSAQQPFALEQGAIGLALLGDQDTGPALVSIFEEANPTVQASIASAMGWIRDPRTLQMLTRRLGDPTRSTISRSWAAVAIGRIADVDEWPWVARFSTDVQYDVTLPELLDPQFEQGLLDLR